MVDSSKVTAFVNALSSKFENKQANKKTDISGDFSSDTASYPTVQSVKAWVGAQGYLTSYQDVSGKEDTSNKVSSWSATTNNTHYPTEKLVKDSLDAKISKSATVGLMKNDGTVDTSVYLTSHQDISGKANVSHTHSAEDIGTPTGISFYVEYATKHGYVDGGRLDRFISYIGDVTYNYIPSLIVEREDPSYKVSQWSSTTNNDNYPSEKLVKDSLDDKISKSSTVGLVKNDGSIDTTTYLSSHQDISGKENTSNKVSSWSSTTNNTRYPSEKLVKDSLDDKISKSSTSGLVKNDGTIDTNTYLTSHQSLNSKTVTVEKQATAESGYLATYYVKQNNAKVGDSINIPKDYLVKSASMGTVATANTPVSGYAVGDKYLDFVINTKDNTGTDEHLYINVKDLIDTYTAGTGISISNNTISLSTSTVDSEIDDYLDAITTALSL